MRKALSKIDKIILLCRNVEKTTSIYCQTLGLRVFVQSKDFAQLRDASNLPIYLQQSKNPSQLSKGYSPILSFKVDHFDEVYSKLLRCDLIPDGDIVETKKGKLATFLGNDGQTISINNLEIQEVNFQSIEKDGQVDNDEIKRILQKIKL